MTVSDFDRGAIEASLFPDWKPVAYPDWFRFASKMERVGWQSLYAYAARALDQLLADDWSGFWVGLIFYINEERE